MDSPEKQIAAQEFVEEYGNQILTQLNYRGQPPVRYGDRWAWSPGQSQGNEEVIVNIEAFGDETYKPEWKVLAFTHEIDAHHAPARREPESATWDKRWGEQHKAGHIFLNVLADIAGNRSIISKVPSTQDEWRDFYASKLFPEADLRTSTDQAGNSQPRPRHMQFLYAMLRETFVPDEPCEVDPEVREKLDTLHDFKGSGQDLIGYATQPFKTPTEYLTRMEQMKLWQRGIWPTFTELYDEDLEDRNNQQGGEGDPSQSSGGQAGDGSSGNPFEGDYKDYDENHHPATPSNKDELGDGKGDDDKSEYQKVINSILNRNPETTKDQSVKDSGDKSEPSSGNSTPKGEPERKKAEAAQAEIAKSAGVSVADYKEFSRQMEAALPEIMAMREVFEQFISERLAHKRQLIHRQPEGILLDPDNLAQTIAQINNDTTDEMPAFLDYGSKEKQQMMSGKLDFWLVTDTSFSMGEDSPPKSRLASQGAITILEGLDMFNDMMADESRRQGFNLDFDARTAVITFNGDFSVPKPLGLSLTIQERVAATKGIASTGGGTNAAPPLSYIKEHYQSDDMASGRKKVVVLLTDGKDGNPSGVASEIQALRDIGVLVYPIYLQSSVVDSAGMRLDDISQLPSELSKRVKESLL